MDYLNLIKANVNYIIAALVVIYLFLHFKGSSTKTSVEVDNKFIDNLEKEFGSMDFDDGE